MPNSRPPSEVDLARELVAAEARERRKVAELLHDDVLQMLAAARMALAARDSNEQADELIQRAIVRSREICRGIEPTPVSSRLEDSLPHVIDSIRKSHGLRSHLTIRSCPRAHQTSHDVLVSCLGELLANVARHAPGSEARVTLDESDHWVHLRVDDNGPGFSSIPSQSRTIRGGMGLPLLRRRLQALSGDLDWWTRPSGGASVLVMLPR